MYVRVQGVNMYTVFSTNVILIIEIISQTSVLHMLSIWYTHTCVTHNGGFVEVNGLW